MPVASVDKAPVSPLAGDLARCGRAPLEFLIRLAMTGSPQPQRPCWECAPEYLQIPWQTLERALASACLACVYPVLLLEFQVCQSSDCLRRHRRLRRFLQEFPVLLHGLIHTLLRLRLLHVRRHVMQFCQRALLRGRLVVLCAAAEESSTQARSQWRGGASASSCARLGARGSIVAISDAEPRLDLLGHQALPASLKLVDGDVLNHLSLPRHQDLHTLQCATNAFAELCNLRRHIQHNCALPLASP